MTCILTQPFWTAWALAGITETKWFCLLFPRGERKCLPMPVVITKRPLGLEGTHHSLLGISPPKGNALLGFSRSMWDSQVVISIPILDVPCSRSLANGAFVLMRIRGHRSFLFTPHLPPRDFLFFSHLLGNWVGNRKWHVAIGLGVDEPLESVVPQFLQWHSNDTWVLTAFYLLGRVPLM